MGHGGMASVYEAIHLDLKKRVAIKTLLPAVAASAEARARFLREGEAASRIRHPNVVDVTDVGTAGGTAYLVMEFLEGEDLAAMIERTGAMPIAAAIDILLPVVGAIAVAHEEGVIHRDLKPGNVFMARPRHGGPKPTVLDFGISKLSSGGANPALTATGTAMGTPHYVAPEQVRSAATADERSDQYALGAILYEMLTGRCAHQGDSIYAVIRTVGEGSFPPPRAHRPDIPPALEQAVLRAMALDPTRRFPSVQALGRALLPFASAAAAGQWAPALAGGGIEHGHAPSEPSPVRTPANANAARSAISNTTLGSGAVQVVGRSPRLRASLVVGGFALLMGGAVGAYVLLAPAPRHTTGGAARPAVDGVVVPPPRATEKAPPRFHVAVTAFPNSAGLELDGKPVGVGQFDQELPADGAEHTLKISAPGFMTASLSFRDHPPPSAVTLEPAAPGTTRPTRTKHHEHDGSRRKSAGSRLNAAPIMD